MANLRVDKITSTETFEKTGSVQFDGTTDFLSLSSNTDFAMGTGDFTVECWVYVVSDAHAEGAYGQRVFDSNTGQLGIYINSDGTGGYVGALVSGTDIRSTVAHGIAAEGTWTHAAICRSGDDFRIFVNGREAAYRSGTGSVASSADFRIGARASGQGGLKGHISNFRAIKGKALYTSNFKPPMRELEVTAETVLLACQSKTDASLEKTGKAITTNGNAVASELTPGILTPVVKSGGGSAITGSVEFGENDYLTLTPSTDFNLGTGDFTIEFWIHPQKRFTSYPNIFQINDSVNASKLYINFRNGANLALTDATTVFAQNGSFNLDDWFHVAVVRTSGESRLYMNGVGGSPVGCTRDFGGSNDGIVYIGFENNQNSVNKYNGHISNLRVVKGTALYTDNFIPPTRELKKVPGTVLLCCQDPDSPLTEATGKTITGYGNLQRADDVELITNGTFNSDVSNWTATDCTLTYSSGQMQVTRSGGGGLTANQAFTTVTGNTYILSGTINSSGSRGDLRVYNGSGTGGSMIVSLTGTNGAVTDLRGTFIASSTTSTVVIAIDDNSTSVTVDNISVTLAEGSNKGSNFTPQVGDDRQITFEGVTKINTDAYFYLPTGDTITRDSSYGRGVRAGGYSGTTNKTIEYFNIAYEGESREFGDLTVARETFGGCSSSTRGLFAAGNPGSSPNNTDNIDFITLSNTANAIDFGNLGQAKRGIGSCSNQTRGIFAGGDQPGTTNIIDFVNIATTGNTRNFGDLTVVKSSFDGCSSPIRAIFGGGNNPSTTDSDVIDYVTISSTGNALDFGNLTDGRRNIAACSSSTRAIFGGGRAPGLSTIIDYITIASIGNASDFGDLTVARNSMSGVSNDIRGVFQGGSVPSVNATIDFVTIASTGNATAWGTLKAAAYGLASASDSHGGLG